MIKKKKVETQIFKLLECKNPIYNIHEEHTVFFYNRWQKAFNFKALWILFLIFSSSQREREGTGKSGNRLI
jgi:hypothetical protein